MTTGISRATGAAARAFAICATLALSPVFAADFPTGTFAAKKTPITLSFDDKGEFRVNQRDMLQVAGSYSATASQLKFTDTKGPWPCTKAGEQTGTYAWKYESAVLTLIKLTDKCTERVNRLIGVTWQQQR